MRRETDSWYLVIYGGTYQAGRAKEQVKSNFTWDKHTQKELSHKKLPHTKKAAAPGLLLTKEGTHRQRMFPSLVA